MCIDLPRVEYNNDKKIKKSDLEAAKKGNAETLKRIREKKAKEKGAEN